MDFEGFATKTDQLFESVLSKIFDFFFREIHSINDFITWLQKKLIPFTLIVGLILIVIIIVIRRIRAGTIKGHKEPGTKGLKKNRNKDRVLGIFLGKDRNKYVFSPIQKEEHILLFGRTGIGKTTCFIIQTLLSWVKKGTALVFEIAGDIRKNIPDANSIVYEPESPDNNVRYNVFGPIDMLRTNVKKDQALDALASLIIPIVKNDGSQSAYYRNFGRDILSAALKAFYSVGMDFIDICKAICFNDYYILFDMIESTGHLNAIKSVMSFRRVQGNFISGAKQVIDMALRIYVADSDLINSIGRGSTDVIGLEPQMLEEHIIYISVSDSKHELYRSFFDLIAGQYMDYFSSRKATRKSMPILFCLDELSSFGHLDILPALRKYRKHKIRVMAATQSLADLELNYGKTERTALIDNFGLIAVLSATDPDTQDYLARMIGKKTVFRKNTTIGSSNTTSDIEAKDWIIEPTDFAHLDSNYILIHPHGFAKLRKVPFYK